MEIISPFTIEVNPFDNLNFLYLFYVGLLGLCFGSFCHASALRIVNNKDIIFQKSRCDHCNKVLSWWHIIPVVGFILCYGRCQFCNKKISIQNLTSELFLSLLFVLYFIHFDTENFIFNAIFSCLFLICMITDWTKMQLNFPVMILIIILGIIFNSFLNVRPISSGLVFSFYGILAGWVLIYLINQIYFYFRKMNGFGEGDKWLLAGIGSWLGYEQMFFIFIYATILSALWGITNIMFNNLSIKTKIPFGSFLCIITFFHPIIIFYK